MRSLALAAATLALMGCAGMSGADPDRNWAIYEVEDHVRLVNSLDEASVPFQLVCLKSRTMVVTAGRDQIGDAPLPFAGGFYASDLTPGTVALDAPGVIVIEVPITKALLESIKDATQLRIMHDQNGNFASSEVDTGDWFEGFAEQCAAMTGT
jgi:hypothetical protein